MAIQITFNDYAFHAAGSIQWGRSVVYEPDAQGGIPRRARITWTVQEIFKEGSFADNQARLDEVSSALAVAEGRLRIVDENGRTVYNVMVRPEKNNLPVAWHQTLSEVTLSFTSYETFCGIPPGVSVAPIRGGVEQAPIALDNPMDWKEAIRVERYANTQANRKEALNQITAMGRVYSDSNAAELDRRRFLEALKTRIEKASDSPEAALRFLVDPANPSVGFNRVVRVEHFEAAIHEAEYLTWTLTAFYRRFDAAGYAEAEFKFARSETRERNEIDSRLSGKIRSDTEKGARDKALAILAMYSNGRLLMKQDEDVSRCEGTDGEAFLEFSFSYDFRELGTSTSYKLDIQERADTRSGQLISVYSGTVTAPSSASALAKARQLGDGKHPLRLNATETVSVLGINSRELFVEVKFSYEYQRTGTWQYAEVASEPTRETFGQWAFTVSGYTVASTETAALALARTFKIAGLEKSEKETSHYVHKDGGVDLFVRVDFSYAYSSVHQTTAINYKRQVSKDYLGRTQTITFSGSAYGPTEAEADTLINDLIAGGAGGGWPIRDDRDPQSQSAGGKTVYLGTSFTVSFGSPLSYDGIFESEFTIEVVSQVNHAVITPIPYSTTPHVQEQCGMTIGSITVTGSATASTPELAENWGKSLRGLAENAERAHKEPAHERLQQVNYPLNTTMARAYRFHFTYRALVA